MTFSLPHTFLDLPEEGPQTEQDRYLKKLRESGLQVEENFRALQTSPQLSQAIWQQAPQARAYNSANISVTTATWTALTFDSERYDLGAASEQHSTSTNTGRLTCRRAGLYSIGATVIFDVNTTGTRLARLRLNGSTLIAEPSAVASTAGLGTGLVFSTDYRLTVGDYVDVAVYQDSGGNLNVLASGNESPEFYWHWVSP